MTYVNFTIPGKPGAKGRPRFTRSGTTYTPKKTVEYENLVRLEYQMQGKGLRFPDDACLGMDVMAYYPIPKSASKDKKKEMDRGRLRPGKRPDVDNILKVIADSLNGIAYNDDAQIVKAVINKFYSNEPRVEVYIWTMTAKKG